MRVCVISQYFPPDTGGASTRASNLVRSLQESGHEAVVITGFPHYPDGVIPPRYRRKIISFETIDGARVIRVWIPPLPHKGALYRFVLYTSFAISSLLALPFCRTPKKTWAVSPNYLCMVPATISKLLTGTTVIHDVVDVWPDALKATGLSIPRIVVAATSALARASYALSDHITTVSLFMKAGLRETVPRNVPIDVIENCVDDSFFEIPAKPSGPDLTIMYLGTLSPSNDFNVITEAAHRLQCDGFAKFTIAGSGELAESIGISLKTRQILNLDFYNKSVPHESVPTWLERADSLVLSLKPGFGDTSFPSKLGEYLASGRPVICAADGKLGQIIRDREIAFLVEPGSSDGLVKAITSLHNDPHLTSAISSRGRDYALANFSYDAFRKKANMILESMPK